MTSWMKLWGKRMMVFTPGRLVFALEIECTLAGGELLKAGTRSTALSQHCICGNKAKKKLSDRTHVCTVCSYTQDRDLLSACLGITVDFATTDENKVKPSTAFINPIRLQLLQKQLTHKPATLVALGGQNNSSSSRSTGTATSTDDCTCGRTSRESSSTLSLLPIKMSGTDPTTAQVISGVTPGCDCRGNRFAQKRPPP